MFPTDRRSGSKSVHMCPFSLSLATRVSTSGTTEPACLTGGSSTLMISIRAPVSTPTSLGVTFLMGFFLAFYGEKKMKNDFKKLRTFTGELLLFRTETQAPYKLQISIPLTD